MGIQDKRIRLVDKTVRMQERLPHWYGTVEPRRERLVQITWIDTLPSTTEDRNRRLYSLYPSSTEKASLVTVKTRDTIHPDLQEPRRNNRVSLRTQDVPTADAFQALPDGSVGSRKWDSSDSVLWVNIELRSHPTNAEVKQARGQ